MEYCDILALSVLAFGFDTCFLSLSISFLLAKSTKTMQNELFKKVKYECTTMRELQFHLVFVSSISSSIHNWSQPKQQKSTKWRTSVCTMQVLSLATLVYFYLRISFAFLHRICADLCMHFSRSPFLIESIAIKCIFSHYVSYILCFVSSDERFGYSVFTLFHEVATLLSVIWFPFSHTCRRHKK